MENENVIEALDHLPPEQTEEIVELGAVSNDTHGTFAGHSLDGGFGFKKP